MEKNLVLKTIELTISQNYCIYQSAHILTVDIAHQLTIIKRTLIHTYFVKFKLLKFNAIRFKQKVF